MYFTHNLIKTIYIFSTATKNIRLKPKIVPFNLVAPIQNVQICMNSKSKLSVTTEYILHISKSPNLLNTQKLSKNIST